MEGKVKALASEDLREIMRMARKFTGLRDEADEETNDKKKKKKNAVEVEGPQIATLESVQAYAANCLAYVIEDTEQRAHRPTEEEVSARARETGLGRGVFARGPTKAEP